MVRCPSLGLGTFFFKTVGCSLHFQNIGSFKLFCIEIVNVFLLKSCWKCSFQIIIVLSSDVVSISSFPHITCLLLYILPLFPDVSIECASVALCLKRFAALLWGIFLFFSCSYNFLVFLLTALYLSRVVRSIWSRAKLFIFFFPLLFVFFICLFLEAFRFFLAFRFFWIATTSLLFHIELFLYIILFLVNSRVLF